MALLTEQEVAFFLKCSIVVSLLSLFAQSVQGLTAQPTGDTVLPLKHLFVTFQHTTMVENCLQRATLHLQKLDRKLCLMFSLKM